VVEATPVSLLTLSGGVQPFAGEHVGLVGVLAVLLASLAVVLHEILAEVKLQVVGWGWR